MIKFVTSFSESGYHQYAKNMLESVVKHWKNDLKLIAYYHDLSENLIKDLPKAENIEYRNLNDVPDMLAYRESMAQYDGTLNGKLAYNWRLDAIKWCHKIYALTDLAFEIADQVALGGWLIWLDADTVTTKPLSEEKILKLLHPNVDIAYLSRPHDDYSETSFIAFNLNHDAPLFLLGDLRGCYDIGEVVMYREWHDGFIFERLLKIYIAHGLKAKSLTANFTKDPPNMPLQAFKNSPLSEYMVHYKGQLKAKLFTETVSPDVHAARYKQLSSMVGSFSKSGRIVEVGTWNGGRAIEMATAAFKNLDEVHYVGFDLFEEASYEVDQKESNFKPHNTMDIVSSRLTEFATKIAEKQNKKFTFKLFKGDSKLTLKQAKESGDLEGVDFAFIDGGHSEETVRSDYAVLKDIPYIVFDDFFTKDENGKIWSDEHLGINRLVEELGKEGKQIKVLPSSDRVLNGGITHLVALLNQGTLADLSLDLLKVPIVVHPRDSMPKDYIINSINQNINIIKNWGFVKACPVNNEEAIIVSGGPSINWKELKKTIRSTGGPVIAVKHSYPLLLEHGIEPFACVVLDPRPIDGISTHGIVRKDLFKKISPNTKFLVASMTDVSVTKYLMEHSKNVYGWHAFTDSVRNQNDTKKFSINPELKIAEDTTFVTGGTCAAMRSLGMFHILGFRHFHLFGFDCSFPDVTEEMQKEIVNDKPKYFKVETNGSIFWTTGELLAMAQDCEKMFSNKDIDMNIIFHGEQTLVSEVFKTSEQSEKFTYRMLFKDK